MPPMTTKARCEHRWPWYATCPWCATEAKKTVILEDRARQGDGGWTFWRNLTERERVLREVQLQMEAAMDALYAGDGGDH